LLLPGCSSFYIDPESRDYNSNIKKLNYLGNIYPADLYIADSLIECSRVELKTDTLLYTDYQSGAIISVPADSVQKIKIRDQVTRVFNTIWIPIGTWVATGIISIASQSIYPVAIGVELTPVSALSAFIFTGYKEFIFIHSHQKNSGT
jgi:hypothetical protein